MRNFLKSAGRWLGIGWFWAGVLLVLPNCGLNSTGLGGPPPPNLNAGSEPRSDAIFCDIEKPSGRHCATDMEKTIGISLSDAAVALNEGRTSSIGLDYSEAALANCGGEPEAVEYQGMFPEGLPVCVNCGEVITGVESYGDVTTACRAKCYDFFGQIDAGDGTLIPDNPPSVTNKAFCDAQAKASTNFPLDGCFAGACSSAGTWNPGFFDPRRTPEAVFWTDFIGAASGGTDGNDLTKTAATAAYDAGAVSSQWIKSGNAYVEFSVTTTNQRQVIGLSSIPAACADPCPDMDANYTDIGYSVGLGLDARYYVVENGVTIAGPDVGLSFGTYSADERFRVSLKDNHDGTATVTYSRVEGICKAGNTCNVVDFYTASAPATYPFRVDASLYEQSATLSDVRLVYIK
jgi:hypothetical protein